MNDGFLLDDCDGGEDEDDEENDEVGDEVRRRLLSKPEPLPFVLMTNLAGDEPEAYNELSIEEALNLPGELIEDNP